MNVAQRADVVHASCHIQGVEDGGESRKRVGARGVHLAHDVDQDGASLTYAEAYLAVGKTRTQLCTQSGVGLVYGKAAQLHRAEALDGDVAVGRDGGVDALLRGAVNLNGYGIARPQTIVGRRGYIHVRLEAQRLVVEDVVTENFVLLLLLLLQQLLQQGQRVDGHQPAQLGLHLQELRVFVVVGVLPDGVLSQDIAAALPLPHIGAPLLAVVRPHAALGLAHGLVGHVAQPRLLDLPLVFAFHALQLLNVNASAHQPGHYLGL